MERMELVLMLNLLLTFSLVCHSKPPPVSLWLDDNNYLGTTIPSQIALLPDLASFSIANTGVLGTIPSEIGLLSGSLRRFWLYDNELSGFIPTEMEQLSQLEVLELHGNNLFGTMPFGLCRILESTDYEFASLTSDCISEVECVCCTECY